MADDYSPAEQAIFASPSLDTAKTDDKQVLEEQKVKWAAERSLYKPFVPALLARDLVRTLPPPTTATPSASIGIGREVRAMMKSQQEQSPQSLGYYFE